jgi:uncharacterized protein YecE (DUF72 family)
MGERIHIGTSGWSYKHWKERFYTAGVKPADYLRFYSQQFDCTEITASFYRMPTPETVEKWAATVPDDFRFCPKLSRYLTHIKRLREPEEPMERFFTAFSSMSKKLGPVLAQLPPNMKYDPERADHFFTLLSTRYSAHTFVLEVRHTSWLENDALDAMARHGIGLVVSQSGVGFPYSEMVTAQIVYLRFHGPAELYASPYSEEMLREYAQRILCWREEGHSVWAFFNNDIHGYAVQDARRLRALLA